MGLAETLNRAVFNLTYNEQASQAYDEQNAQAAGAVEDLKKQIDGYRSTREKIIGAGESTDYFSSNAMSRITEWENWLQSNAGAAAGDYTKKSTEMKTQWDSLLNINKVVKEMARVEPFLDLYLKDKDTKIPAAEKREIETLKADAKKYYEKIVNQTPADILAKRDELNRKFEEIQKKIPENFEDLKEPYQDASQAPVNLLAGIQEENFNRYQTSVEKKEVVDESNFSVSRLFSRVIDYATKGFGIGWPYFFGLVFAMIVANDAIGRPVPYRLFYAFFMFLLFQVSLIPGFSILVLAYYIYRSFIAVNWGNVFSLNPAGPRLDLLKAPVLFAFLPIFEGRADEVVPWYMSIFKYDVNRYGGLAKKKQMAYEMNAAKLVGQTLDASSFGLDEKSFNQVMCELKSVLSGTYSTLDDAFKSLKQLA
jgi:hypothetical protein